MKEELADISVRLDSVEAWCAAIGRHLGVEPGGAP